MQQSLFGFGQEKGLAPISLPDADIAYDQAFLSKHDADDYFTRCKEAVAWQQDDIKLFDKVFKIPRLHAWYGDANTQYMASGLVMRPLSWLPVLQELKLAVEQACHAQFNSVLCNLYRDGNDSVSWHADDEPELGKQPKIASLTLGESRFFELKHNISKQKYRINLEHGSLLFMGGDSQRCWQHALPKSQIIRGQRINLTFRWVDNEFRNL